MRILLVEDNADHRELMWSALTEYDATWQVEGVVSGEAALRRLAEGEPYDLVFLDYSLPRRDGLEVLEEIRRGKAPPPVVVVTGRGDERVAVEAMKGGAYDYVVKGEGYLQRLPVVVQLALVAHQLAVERKRAEETLWESQELYRSLFKGVPIGLYRTMPGGEILDANPALMEMLGYPDRESLLVVNLADMFVNPEDRKQRKALMESQGVVRDFEARFQRYDGTVIWIRDTCRAARHDDGQALYHEGAIEDITERKRAEEALRKSEERYRTLFEESIDAIYITTREGKFTDINRSGLELFGYTKEEIMRLNIKEIYADPDDRPKFQQEIEQKGFVGDYEIKFHKKDGAVIDCLVTAIVQRANAGSILGYQGIIRDITERKRAEEQLKSSREQLRALSAHLQSVREEERTLIAREIHDELGQELTGLKMDLSWLIKRLPKDQELDVKKVESMLKLVDTTIQSVRRISTKLRPGVLDDLGLTATIEWQAQDFQTRIGVECTFSSNLGEIDLDRDRSTAVFRILQETLTNVARHASATWVNICLDETAASLVLIVEDNGRGITEREIFDPKSLGLLGMRERALVFGGEVKISGAPGKGTTVTLRIPLQK